MIWSAGGSGKETALLSAFFPFYARSDWGQAERAKSFCELTQKWNSTLKRLYLLLRVFFWFLISLRLVREKTDKDIRFWVLSKAQGLETSRKWKKLQPEKVNDLTLSAVQCQTEASLSIRCGSLLHWLEECFRLIPAYPQISSCTVSAELRRKASWGEAWHQTGAAASINSSKWELSQWWPHTNYTGFSKPSFLLPAWAHSRHPGLCVQMMLGKEDIKGYLAPPAVTKDALLVQ